MATVAELQIVLEAQDRASGQLRALGTDVQRLERQVDEAGGAFGRLRGIMGGLTRLGFAATGIGAIIEGAVGAARAITGTVTAASDLNEQLSRSQVIFGDAASEVQTFARTTGLALGITQTQALEAAGSFGTLFRTSGLAEQSAADMSTTLVRLAADLASFNNIDPGDALERLRSGLVGESEPLRTLGVLLSEEAVKLKAVELGIASSTKELTEAQKVQARYALILEQTRTAQGDFARTSTGLANAIRVIRAAFGDIQAQLGQAVLPTIARLAQLLVHQLPAITASVQQFAAQVAPILEQVFSGDITGGLTEVAARLGPILAEWSQAFWDWVGTMTPELLRRLADLGGAIFAWIKAQAPVFTEWFLGDWVPAFFEWVAKVLPPLLVELGKIIKTVADWAETTGKPELEALGLALGGALIAGFRKALDALFVRTAATTSAEDWRKVIEGSKTAPLAGSIPLPGAAGGTINVGPITIGGTSDPAFAERFRQALTEFIATFIGTGMGTDPGASPQLQGAGR